MSPSPRRPSVTDVLVALGTGVATVAAVVAAPQLLEPDHLVVVDPVSWWVTGAALVLQAIALCFARPYPRSVLLVTAILALLVGVFTPTGIANITDAAVIVAVLRAALLVPARELRVLLPIAALCVAVGQAGDIIGSSSLPWPTVIGAAILQAIAIVGLPSVGVLAVTARRDAQRARTGESEAIRRERDALVQAAVAQERTGMARELHDIAAHHVSSIALMSAAIERQIDTDPALAKRQVRQVREQSRVLLDDLRRLVGLLRRDADAPDAIETLETIPTLVDTARATGRDVDLRVSGGGGDIGPLAQLVAYRMVQEALANAGRHAPDAACTVELDGSASDLFVAIVRNAPSATPAAPAREGFGLLGMRERAALVGGTLDAGADPDGGWTVRLTLPSEPPERLEPSVSSEPSETPQSSVPSVPSDLSEPPEPSADSRKDPA
jgi:signal transduction histidine kinase